MDASTSPQMTEGVTDSAVPSLNIITLNMHSNQQRNDCKDKTLW